MINHDKMKFLRIYVLCYFIFHSLSLQGQLTIENIHITKKKITFCLKNVNSSDFILNNFLFTPIKNKIKRKYAARVYWITKDTLHIILGQQEDNSVQITCGGNKDSVIIDGIERKSNLVIRPEEKCYFIVSLHEKRDRNKIRVIKLMLNKGQVIVSEIDYSRKKAKRTLRYSEDVKN